MPGGAAQTLGTDEVFEFRGAQESGPPVPRHPWSEACYVLEGELEVTIAGERRLQPAGSLVPVPPDTWHSCGIAASGARFPVLTSGAGAGAFFNDLGREVGATPDLARILAVAARHRVIPAPPA